MFPRRNLPPQPTSRLAFLPLLLLLLLCGAARPAAAACSSQLSNTLADTYPNGFKVTRSATNWRLKVYIAAPGEEDPTDNFAYTAYTECPTFRENVHLIEESTGDEIMHQKKAVVSFGYNFDIVRCIDDKLIATVDEASGSVVVNRIAIDSELQILDENEKVIGFSRKEGWLDQSVTIYDAENADVVVANASYSIKFTLHPTWEVHYFNRSHPAGAPEIIAFIVAHRLVKDEDNFCTPFLFTALGVALLCCAAGAWQLYSHCVSGRQMQQVNNTVYRTSERVRRSGRAALGKLRQMRGGDSGGARGRSESGAVGPNVIRMTSSRRSRGGSGAGVATDGTADSFSRRHRGDGGGAATVLDGAALAALTQQGYPLRDAVRSLRRVNNNAAAAERRLARAYPFIAAAAQPLPQPQPSAPPMQSSMVGLEDAEEDDFAAQPLPTLPTEDSTAAGASSAKKDNAEESSGESSSVDEGAEASLDVDALFELYDADGDGQISIAEFSAAASRFSGKLCDMRRAREMVDAFDIDFDGQLNREEFKELILAMD